MAELKSIALSLKQKIEAAGIPEYSFEVTEREVRELNTEGRDFSLYRTLFHKKSSVEALMDGRKGTSSGNDFTEEGLTAVVEAAKAGAENAQADAANAIAEKQVNETFTRGPQEADMDGFYHRLEELFETVRTEYPKVALMQVIAAHNKTHTIYENSNGTVFETIATNNIQQVTTLPMRDILQRHLFRITRDMIIDILEYRDQFLNKRTTFLIDQSSMSSHLFFPYIKQRGIRFIFHLQKCITLLQCLVIAGQSFYITMVILRDDNIHQLTTIFTTTFYQHSI